MQWILRRVAGLLTVGGVAVALLIGPAATSQATVLTPQCPGGCAQSGPDGFQVSCASEDLSTDGNWEPN
ncbi:hypothetical protein ADL30_09840 [Streptomyces sp. NRRL S-1521]|nr:hypothetical protein ADL30_09840 [Streptomyces sp. NRRL S-1521]